MVDVAMVAAEAKADSHGNTLPLNILEGSLVVASESANDLDPVPGHAIFVSTMELPVATVGPHDARSKYPDCYVNGCKFHQRKAPLGRDETVCH